MNFVSLVFVVWAGVVQAQEECLNWIAEGPKLVDGPKSFDIPLTISGTKLFVTVEMGGKPRRFVIDMRSPTMVSSSTFGWATNPNGK